MNRKLLDQFQALALPELLEDSLEEGDTHCVAFNRWGTILAAGLSDGKVLLWDFETRGVARSTQVHTAAVTALAFSEDGRLLIATAADGSAKLWNIETNLQEGEMNLGQHILHVSMSRKDPRLCLVSFPSIAPSLIDFSEERAQTLPCLQIDVEKGGRPVSSGIHEGTMAIFSKSGELVFLTLANGSVAVLKASNLRFLDIVKVPGGSRAINMALSRNGKHLVVNFQDRVIRAFQVEKDSHDDRKTYSLPELRNTLAAMQEMPREGSVLYPGDPLLSFASHTYQNLVDKNHWQIAIFTCDSEYVVAAQATKNVHHIQIWTRWGRLDRILEGPNNGVRDLAWHPTRSLMASVSTSGAIYLWARVQAENWSAFAPDFTELQENEEYVEPEDIFDLNPKPQEEANGVDHMEGVQGGDTIDILAPDETQAESSDVEADLRGFRHLPIEIIPQEFNEKGELVVAKPEAAREDDSPQPSSMQDSEPAISDEAAEDSKGPSVGPEGKHRLAASSLPVDEPGFRLRPGRQKRYLDDFEEDEDFMDDAGPRHL